MIHHLARAFFVRNNATFNGGSKPPTDGERPASAPAHRPVRARPITPWGNPPRPDHPATAAATHGPTSRPPALATSAPVRHLRISTDPFDARRTVITGRFAEVCAALDRLVMEQEATA